MTTRGSGGRSAVTHYEVRERIDSPYGKFALLDVRIETGRTHQIRVHMAALGHTIVGDTLYGAPSELKPNPTKRPRTPAAATKHQSPPVLRLVRNFLHAAALQFQQPRSGEARELEAPLPPELLAFLEFLHEG